MVMVADKQTKIMLSNQTIKEKWGKIYFENRQR